MTKQIIKKIVTLIHSCDECGFLGWNQFGKPVCRISAGEDRIIDPDFNNKKWGLIELPPWCPLEDYDEK